MEVSVKFRDAPQSVSILCVTYYTYCIWIYMCNLYTYTLVFCCLVWVDNEWVCVWIKAWTIISGCFVACIHGLSTWCVSHRGKKKREGKKDRFQGKQEMPAPALLARIGDDDLCVCIYVDIYIYRYECIDCWCSSGVVRCVTIATNAERTNGRSSGASVDADAP